MKNSDLEYIIEEIHDDCFDTSFFYRKHIFKLDPSFDETKSDAIIPTVLGCVSSDDNWLDITFILQNIPNTISLPSFDLINASHNDYLWQQNCLELFVCGNDADYYEVNVSFDGKYAIYQFDSYRNPEILPPRKSSDITFQWRDVGKQDVKIGLDLVYQFSLLFSQGSSFNVDNINLINPCAILYRNINGEKQPIYYAVNHANPPDFHDKTHWINF